jgi:pimeloyl-ACP methyl ester carboxylesterase
MAWSTAQTASRWGGTIRLATGTYTGAASVPSRASVNAQDGATITATGLYLLPGIDAGTVTLNGVSSSRRTGAVTSGVEHLLMVPEGFTGDGSKMGVIYLHGATGTCRQMVDGVGQAGVKKVLLAVAQAGYPILGVSTGDAWGNDTAMTRMDAAKTYLQSTVGAKAGAVGLIGGSMGGCNVLNWAKRNLASTACAVGLVPVSDITDIHTNNRASLATNIDGAYSGGWSEATYGAARNPATFAAAGDLAGLDYLAFGGATDATCLPATVEAVCTSIGVSAQYVEVVGSHNSAIANITTQDVVDFLDLHET